MDWQTYAQEVLRTAGATQPGDMLASAALGLCGEAGEVADVVKKHLFHSHKMDVKHAAEELGDVLWYWTLMCIALGVPPDAVVAMNVDKLRARYPDGFSAERSINRGE